MFILLCTTQFCKVHDGFNNAFAVFFVIKEKYKTDIAEGYIVKGVYITSSNYEDDAIEYLDIMNSGKLKPKKIDVYYDRTKLLDLFEKNDFKTLKNIIEKFYL